MGISEKKTQIVINNYFKQECDVNTSIREAFEKGFRIGIKKASSAKPDWILCSERLPEDDTEVLVYLFENNKSPYIAWLSDARWYTEYFEVERENEPVAWMPLPEPYKG